jgi:excisionase family DNA binding protein
MAAGGGVDVRGRLRETGPDLMEPLTYSVMEAAKALGVGRQGIYQLINSGGLDAVRIGRRILVPRHALRKLVGLPQEEGTSPAEAPPQHAAPSMAPERAPDAPEPGVTYVITVRKVGPGQRAYVAEEPPSPWSYRRR